MKEQNYRKHKRYVMGYHGIAFSLEIVLFFMSVYNLYAAFITGNDVKESLMFFIASILLIMLFLYARSFALKAQDRAIRAEENLRHFVLTGNLFDPKTTMAQILALRFSPDDEFLELSKKAVKESLSSEDIKRTIKNWKTDHYRV